MQAFQHFENNQHASFSKYVRECNLYWIELKLQKSREIVEWYLSKYRKVISSRFPIGVLTRYKPDSNGAWNEKHSHKSNQRKQYINIDFICHYKLEILHALRIVEALNRRVVWKLKNWSKKQELQFYCGK